MVMGVLVLLALLLCATSADGKESWTWQSIYVALSFELAACNTRKLPRARDSLTNAHVVQQR